jgi:hypothetical protein
VAENNGVQPKNMEDAAALVLTKLGSRKVGIVCFGIYGISQLATPISDAADPIVRYCLLGLAAIIGVLACYAFRGQTELDKREIELTGRDQPDNGHGHGNGGTHVEAAGHPAGGTESADGTVRQATNGI